MTFLSWIWYFIKRWIRGHRDGWRGGRSKGTCAPSIPASLIDMFFDLTSLLERGDGNLLPMPQKGRGKGYLQRLKPQQSADHFAGPAISFLSQSNLILRPAVEFAQKSPFLFWRLHSLENHLCEYQNDLLVVGNLLASCPRHLQAALPFPVQLHRDLWQWLPSENPCEPPISSWGKRTHFLITTLFISPVSHGSLQLFLSFPHARWMPSLGPKCQGVTVPCPGLAPPVLVKCTHSCQCIPPNLS